VAQHFLRIAGVNRGVTIRKEDVGDDAAGLAYHGRTIPSVRGRSVDHEAVRAECVMLLAGGEAEMHMRGDEMTGATRDYEKADELLHRAVFDAEREAVLRAIPAEELASRTPADLAAEYGSPVTDRWHALLDELRAEARALIEEKWPCVEAVAKELYRKKSLDGDRVTEIIEGVEEQLT
jgi:ATP-dependent Zn protease